MKAERTRIRLHIGVGAEDLRLSNNRIQFTGTYEGGNTGFIVDGYDSAQGLGIDGLVVDHNTVIDEVYDPARYTNGRFLKLSGPIDNLSITNNVYDPNDTPFGAYGSTGLGLSVSATGMDIGGNVWGPAGSLYHGGYHSTPDGWISPSAWLTNYPTDTFPTQLDATSIGTAGGDKLRRRLLP